MLLGGTLYNFYLFFYLNICPVVYKNAGQMKVRLVTVKERAVDMAWEDMAGQRGRNCGSLRWSSLDTIFKEMLKKSLCFAEIQI